MQNRNYECILPSVTVAGYIQRHCNPHSVSDCWSVSASPAVVSPVVTVVSAVMTDPAE